MPLNHVSDVTEHRTAVQRLLILTVMTDGEPAKVVPTRSKGRGGGLGHVEGVGVGTGLSSPQVFDYYLNIVFI